MQIVLQLFNSVFYLFPLLSKKKASTKNSSFIRFVWVCVCMWCVLFVSECDAFISVREKNWYNCFDCIQIFLCLLQLSNWRCKSSPLRKLHTNKGNGPNSFLSSLYCICGLLVVVFFPSGCAVQIHCFSISQSHWMKKQRFVDVQFIKWRERNTNNWIFENVCIHFSVIENPLFPIHTTKWTKNNGNKICWMIRMMKKSLRISFHVWKDEKKMK